MESHFEFLGHVGGGKLKMKILPESCAFYLNKSCAATLLPPMLGHRVGSGCRKNAAEKNPEFCASKRARKKKCLSPVFFTGENVRLQPARPKNRGALIARTANRRGGAQRARTAENCKNGAGKRMKTR